MPVFKRSIQKSRKQKTLGNEPHKAAAGGGKLNREDILRTYTSHQQKIWESQRRSLTSSIPPRPDRPDDKRSLARDRIERQEARRAARTRERYEADQRGYQIGTDRVLRITRQLKDGRYEQETVTDPVVITAYLQAKITESIKREGFSEGGLYMALNRFDGKVANLKHFRIKLCVAIVVPF